MKHPESFRLVDGTFPIGHPDSSHPDARVRHHEVDACLRSRYARILGIPMKRHPPRWHDILFENAVRHKAKEAKEVGLPSSASWTEINQEIARRTASNIGRQ